MSIVQRVKAKNSYLKFLNNKHITVGIAELLVLIIGIVNKVL
jgi:hypothetical protein